MVYSVYHTNPNTHCETALWNVGGFFALLLLGYLLLNAACICSCSAPATTPCAALPGAVVGVVPYLRPLHGYSAGRALLRVAGFDQAFAAIT
jgi:hypothetical protein